MLSVRFRRMNMVTADFSRTVVHLHQITIAHIRPVKTSYLTKIFLF